MNFHQDVIPKETVTSIMIGYKNMKAMVCSPDSNTDFLDIVMGVLQGDTSLLDMFLICLDYIFQILIDQIKESGFPLKKLRSRQYTAETMTNADYSDDLTLLVNTPAQAKSLLLRLEQASGGSCVLN